MREKWREREEEERGRREEDDAEEHFDFGFSGCKVKPQ